MPNQKSSVVPGGVSRLESKIDNKESEFWGHKLVSKQDKHIRLCFQNVNGLPLYNTHFKNNEIKKFLHEKEIDIFCMSETNVCWKRLGADHRWDHRTRDWSRNPKTSFAYIYNDPLSERYQRGGVGIMNLGKMVRRYKSRDQDPLGRWVSVIFKGKKGKMIRVVSLYRPTKNEGKGLTVYSQQRRLLLLKDDDRCPIRAFWEDFWTEMDKWFNQGEVIIVGGDFNEDVTSDKIRDKFSEYGLVNGLSSRHKNCALPNSRAGGSKPIDGIFIPHEIKIERSGYTPIGKGIPSDHRCVWMDIKEESLFGNSIILPRGTRPRRLVMKNRESVKKYTARLEEFCEYHKLEGKIWELRNRVSSPMQPQDELEYERLDKLRMDGIKNAEKHCRKLTMGKLPFCPQTSRLRQEMVLWDLLLKQKRKKKVNVQKIRRMLQRLKWGRCDQLPIEEMEVRRAKVVSKWRCLHKARNRSPGSESETEHSNGKDEREAWLLNKAEEAEHQEEKDKSRRIKDMIQREKQRRCFRRIKTILWDEQNAGVTTVRTRDGSNKLVECTTKEDIEKACLKENKSRFTQAHGTTISRSDITSVVGVLGTNKKCDEILEGTKVDMDLTADQIKMMQCLQAKESIYDEGPMNPWISIQAWTQCWKRQRKRTSGGPSGLHFGHLKVNARNGKLGTIDCLMTAIPFATGYSPRRWQSGTNVMLYKKANDNNVKKLRTILLYEADFNAGNKIIGREMLRNAESHSGIAKEQYGSRKGKSAIIQCLNKRLTFDLWRQTRTPGALLSNDAKSCYDRILHNIAGIAMRRQGVHKNNVVCMFTTIQRLRHTVRTAFGDSTSSFQQEVWLAPLHGVGQGNGAGPAIWAVVSSPILDLLRKEGCGATFRCAMKYGVVLVTAFSFVDDTDIAVGGHGTAKADLVEELQRALNLWQTGIEMSGGGLVPEKSFWTEINFEWDDKGKWHYLDTKRSGNEVTMLDASGRTNGLNKINPNESIETLGVMLAPDGNEVAQMKKMLKKAQNWKSKIIRGGHISRHDAWVCVKTTILKTLEYPLGVTCLSKEDCRKILTPVLDIGLPTIGVSRKFRREFIHGPPSCLGIDIPCLYQYQGAAHIDLLVNHWRSEDDTGRLLRTSMYHLLIETGQEKNPMTLPYDRWKEAVTTSWLKATWKFMWENDIVVDIDIPRIPLRRENDIYLMQTFVDANASPAQLATLNSCRLYLQAITLSDICEADGRRVCQEAWVGGKLPSPRTNIEWPNQGKPGKAQWRLWRSFLRKALGAIKREIMGVHEMGAWQENKTDHNWQWFYDSTQNQLYRKQADIISRFVQATRHNFCKTYTRIDLVRSLPAAAHRCSVIIVHHNKVKLLNRSGPSKNPQYIKQERRLIPFILEKNQEGLDGVISGLHNNSVIAVSDGSYKQGFGTAAFGLKDQTTGKKIRGCVVCPGAKEYQSPYRSELCGIAGILTFIQHLVDKGSIGKCTIEIACDGKSALEQVFEYSDENTKTNQKQFDIIAYCRELVRESSITWKHRHVCGHKDEWADSLDEYETLNVEMDALSKRCWHRFCHKTNGDNTESWRVGFPSVTINGERVGCNLRTSLRQKVAQAKWLSWWREHQTKKGYTAGSIDHSNIGRAMRSIPRHRQVWTMKFAHGTLGVGKWTKRWRLSSDQTCPRCGNKEDHNHIWKCPEAPQWNRNMTSLGNWLIQIRMPDVDRIAFVNEWEGWKENRKFDDLEDCSEKFQVAMMHQRQIGWENLTKGFISDYWSHYFATLRGAGHPTKPTTFIRKIWSWGVRMWNERNEALFGSVGGVTGRGHDLANRIIRYEMDRGTDGLDDQEIKMLRDPLEVTLSGTRNLKRQWIGRINAARKRARTKTNRPENMMEKNIRIMSQNFINNWGRTSMYEHTT